MGHSGGMATLIRPKKNRLLAGVCAAIANWLGWNVWVVRVLWILLSFIPGPLWVFYVVLWIVIPAEPDAQD